LQAQQTWPKRSEWSFWLIRKDPTLDKNSFEFRPSRDKELKVSVNVSFLNKEYNTVTVLISEDSSCNDTIEKVSDFLATYLAGIICWESYCVIKTPAAIFYKIITHSDIHNTLYVPIA